MPKLLTDLGFLLKSSRTDREKLARLCRNFRCGSPELLFQTFPEFFPEAAGTEEKHSAEAARALRSILLAPPQFETHELIMNTRHRFSREWWKTRLRCLRPDNVRLKYQRQNRSGNFILFYFHDLFRKLYNSVLLSARPCSAELTEFQNKLEQIERSSCSGPNHSRRG